jgi:HSP20 family protein
MDRLFDDVLRGAPSSAGQGGSRSGVPLAPNIDVGETDKEVRIEAELPGVSEKEVEVSLNDDVLTVRAEMRQERKEDREGVHVSERAFGTFQRSLRLPFQVNPDQVQARFENGVLKVTIPKAQPQERTRRIQVQGAQQQAGAEPAGQQTGGGQAGDGQTGDGQTGGSQMRGQQGASGLGTSTGGASEDGVGSMPGAAF